LHCLIEGLHRPFGIERIALEVKAQDLALIRLIREDRRGQERLSGLKTVHLVMRRAWLLGPVWRDSTWGLGFLYRIGTPTGRQKGLASDGIKLAGHG
jgi:hypothetical protein